MRILENMNANRISVPLNNPDSRIEYLAFDSRLLETCPYTATQVGARKNLKNRFLRPGKKGMNPLLRNTTCFLGEETFCVATLDLFCTLTLLRQTWYECARLDPYVLCFCSIFTASNIFDTRYITYHKFFFSTVALVDMPL